MEKHPSQLLMAFMAPFKLIMAPKSYCVLHGALTSNNNCWLALFPELASSHVIFKTNNEKCPSLHICLKTARNETFGGFYSFLASQATWSFNYTWGVLVPAIIGPRFIARYHLVATDNANKLYGPYKNHIATRYANGKHCLCTFHGITQGWPKNKITTSCVKSGAGSDIDHAILEAIKTIVMSWMTDVESAKELQMSYECLMTLLRSKDHMKYFDESFPKDVITFVTMKVWVHCAKLAHYEFMRTHSFCTKTSHASEIKGGVLKHHVAGPKPNHSMAKAADSTCKVSNMRIILKEQRPQKQWILCLQM